MMGTRDKKVHWMMLHTPTAMPRCRIRWFGVRSESRLCRLTTADDECVCVCVCVCVCACYSAYLHVYRRHIN